MSLEFNVDVFEIAAVSIFFLTSFVCNKRIKRRGYHSKKKIIDALNINVSYNKIKNPKEICLSTSYNEMLKVKINFENCFAKIQNNINIFQT